MLERFKYPILAAVAVAILVGVIALVTYRPTPVVITINPPLPTGTPAPIKVYVTGAVVAPNMYDLALGSRVQDAVSAAGGFTANADRLSVNIARVLQDGEQVHVLEVGATNPTPLALTSQPVNVNTASAAELQTLPNCSASLAQAIIDYRAQNGPFRSMDDLDKVSGVGPKTLESWQGRVVFG
ncbi:MAG: ComEA family DNA-binding protein [Anaerolineae bacterium]